MNVNVLSGQQVEKAKNKKLICDVLLKSSSMTKKQLAKSVDISIVSITKNADELIEKNVLLVEGVEEHLAKGRKPAVLSINKNYKYVLAVDLGKNPVGVCVGNLAGDILYSDSYTIGEPQQGDEIINDIILLLFRMLAKHAIPSSDVGCIVIANPGIPYGDTGTIIRPAQIAEKWANLPISNIFQTSFHTKNVIVKNDINLAALGMLNKYSPVDQNNYVLLRIDAGIGIGIVLNGSLYEGLAHSAGEMGYVTTVDKSGKVMRESYENIATLPVFISTIKKLVAEKKDGKLYDFVNGDIQKITLQTISKFAVDDSIVKKQIENLATIVGIATINALLLLDVYTVILDGDVLLLGKTFVNCFKNVLNSDRNNDNKITIKVAEDGLPLLGCLKKGSDEIIDKISKTI